MVLGGQIVDLPNGDALVYPFAGFATLGGAVLEGTGVVPDVEVRLSRSALLAGRDPVVEAAVSWITEAEVTPTSDAAESRPMS